MIETAPSAWLAFVVLLGLTTFAGSTLSRCVPWSDSAWAAGIPRSVGLALAPFIAGLGSILVLWLLPGASYCAHLLTIAGGICAVCLGARHFSARRAPPIVIHAPARFGEGLLGVFVALWIIALVVNAVLLPLTQNDALEYASVGRLLYETRNLSDYPAIHPEQSSSGFYGPWTHPPLYVALIYLTHVLQGHANEPGLMRLIAPWFGIAATAVVFSIGNLTSRLTGILAALVFISTPLFFLSADASLIDALPVLGFSLVLAVIVGVHTSASSRGGAIGAALGVALWTHSQAVLFLPLAISAMVLAKGVRDWRTLLREWLVMLAVAAALGLMPYVRNILIFGSPISDNPAVFAMPALAWNDYFRFTRGLDNWMAIIQYGILKGWTILESYGGAFWLMTLGGIVLFRKIGPESVTRAALGGTTVLERGLGPVWVCAGVVLVYFTGVVVSVLLGVDLMVKNDRYILVILPPVAVIAGFGIALVLESGAEKIVDAKIPAWRRDVSFAAATGLLGILIIQLILVGWYYRWRHLTVPIKPSESAQRTYASHAESSRFEGILDYFPSLRAARWIARELPKDAIVLSMRPADMYYANRKIVSFADPRMLPIYREATVEQAVTRLLNMGVGYVQTANYGLPVSYNSILGDVISRPEFSTLIHSSEGTQIYELSDSGKRAELAARLTPGQVPWTRWIQTSLLGGQRLLGVLGFRPQVTEENRSSQVRATIPVAHRAFSTMIALGIGAPFGNATSETLLPVSGGEEYRVALDLRGSAFVRIWIAQFDQHGNMLPESSELGIQRIDEAVLADKNKVHRLMRRFFAMPAATHVRFGIEHVGHSELKIERAEVHILKPVHSPKYCNDCRS